VPPQEPGPSIGGSDGAIATSSLSASRQAEGGGGSAGFAAVSGFGRFSGGTTWEGAIRGGFGRGSGTAGCAQSDDGNVTITSKTAAKRRLARSETVS
jgi:hypothetical protein